MTIGWRLGMVTVQLALLVVASWVVTGRPVLMEPWYAAGLFAVIINPLLLEPYYPRPGDVIANGAIFLFFYGASVREAPSFTEAGWHIGATLATLAIGFAVLGVTLGKRVDNPRVRGLGRAARQLSQLATAKVFYSVAFFLSVASNYPDLDNSFWKLVATWVALLLMGSVNWQSIWANAAGAAPICKIEGNLGPSVLLISAPDIPRPGSWVRLTSTTTQAEAIVLNRIRRSSDALGELHIRSAKDWEGLVAGTAPHLESVPEPPAELVGSVGARSTDTSLTFTATKPLEIGEVVAVEAGEGQPPINYQIVSAQIVRSRSSQGAAQLSVEAQASHLGIFDRTSLQLIRHRWTPPPGAAILRHGDTSSFETDVPPGKLRLGTVIGTELPVFLDLEAACQGHLAILGMTKMGKTTLAFRLAKALAMKNNVTVLDQTGEWVNRRNLKPLTKDRDWLANSLAVFEPKSGEIPADRALKFIEYLLGKATKEYKTSQPFPRTLIVDEAHQFIPEPAGLGFRAPGRDSSYTIGLLMMQIRKYGMSIFLISQRTAVVAKSALSQCENLIAFRSVDQTGLEYLEAVAGSTVRQLLPQLKQGEAVVFGPAVSSEAPVAIEIEQTPIPENDHQTDASSDEPGLVSAESDGDSSGPEEDEPWEF